jgi:hypothetical protein
MYRSRVVSSARTGILAALVVAFASVAQAGPISWGPDLFDPADVYFNSGGAACTASSLSPVCASLAYTHDLTLYGFVPGLSSLDQLTGGLLEIVMRDDESDRPNEAVKLSLEGLLQPGTYDAATSLSFFSFGGVGGSLLLSLQQDGILNVLLERQNGDFVFDRSVFTAQGIRDTPSPTAVPEPASLAMLGLGLAGAGVRRLRKTRRS